MNLYMKHNEYMDRKHKYMYEDDYLPILENRRRRLYRKEIIKLKREFIKQKKIMKWEKYAKWTKKKLMKRMKEKFDLQRSIYRHQFCQDNKFIFFSE
jgi:hypothetical protein